LPPYASRLEGLLVAGERTCMNFDPSRWTGAGGGIDTMTNPDMVKKAGGPNPSASPGDQRLDPPVPAPESDPNLLTRRDPVDSPQLKPMIHQHKSGGLKAPEDDNVLTPKGSRS
jgi:hypothetical protein